MIEVLPIRLLTDEDAPIFGSLIVNLAKLHRFGMPVGNGIVITPPQIKLKTLLEHFDFSAKEVFEQSLTLVKKEINSIPVPQVLSSETGNQKQFLLNGQRVRSAKELWLALLNIWIDQIRNRLWNKGFYSGITDDLDPQAIIFIKKFDGSGQAYFDPLQDDVVINIKAGKLHPNDLKKIVEIVQAANKKLFIPHEYEWMVDEGVKLVGIKPYTASPSVILGILSERSESKGTPESIKRDSGQARLASDESERARMTESKVKSAVKVFFDLSTGLTIEKNVDGVYIDSGKIFDLNKPRDSFDDLVLKLVESAETFTNSRILFKLADKSEGMGKVRGTLRLLHQASLLNPLMDALDFARYKKGLTNIDIVVPYVRGVNELLKIKRELSAKKLSRKNSLGLWMEVAVPENVVNLEDYLVAGVDGVVLNLDELVAYLNGFDLEEGELAFYKNEVEGLLKFLEDGIRLLHKSKIPFIAYGSLALYPKVLEFLVEKGIYGVVVERYEAHSIKDLLYQTEKRILIKRLI